MKLYIIKNSHPQPKSNHPLQNILFKEISIPYFKLYQFDDLNAIKNRFHVISIAYIGLTYFSSICQFSLNIDQYEQEKIIDPVLKNKETGSLYPIHNLTILPCRYSTNAFMTIDSIDFTNGNGFTNEEIRKHVYDAFMAEINYVKSKKMFFDFRDLNDEMRRYNNAVLYFLEGEFKDLNIECYLYSSNNFEFK